MGDSPRVCVELESSRDFEQVRAGHVGVEATIPPSAAHRAEKGGRSCGTVESNQWQHHRPG